MLRFSKIPKDRIFFSEEEREFFLLCDGGMGTAEYYKIDGVLSNDLECIEIANNAISGAVVGTIDANMKLSSQNFESYISQFKKVLKVEPKKQIERVPFTRFRRELNKYLRKISDNKCREIVVTLRGQDWCSVIAASDKPTLSEQIIMAREDVEKGRVISADNLLSKLRR